ncbi:hypothetical protein KUTeg_016574 [Tegillarca granosa]|uniref:PITH domain-containing protein n=1 Tax=Tegillarca granosa TaxID=220873 RepID=A0ABQ9EM68_TEGGR|nr:hypothetical protein KUTeg_016574 [Tegillarca granosa]
MSGHGHSHSCEKEHQHDNVSDSEKAAQFSLYSKIDTEKVQCLNETVDGSGKWVFKPWDKRHDKEKKTITGKLMKSNECRVSSCLRFKNRPNMTFDDSGGEPDQEFEVYPDPEGVIEYNVKVARFNSVEHLCLHFPSNFGADNTKVYYIGLRGDFMEAHRHEVTICTYEARANPADHKTNLLDDVNSPIS